MLPLRIKTSIWPPLVFKNTPPSRQHLPSAFAPCGVPKSVYKHSNNNRLKTGSTVFALYFKHTSQSQTRSPYLPDFKGTSFSC